MEDGRVSIDRNPREERDRVIWIERVDDLRKRLGLKTDKDLAEVLCIVPSQISNWRNGRSELGPITKLVILEKLGYGYAKDALAEIAPEYIKGEYLPVGSTKGEASGVLDGSVRPFIELVMSQSSGRWAMVRERINVAQGNQSDVEETVRDVAAVLVLDK